MANALTRWNPLTDLDDVLTISGQQEEKKEEAGEKFVRREGHYGAFARSVFIPSGVDPSAMAAKVQDGVLELTVPLPEESRGEPVKIKAIEAQ